MCRLIRVLRPSLRVIQAELCRPGAFGARTYATASKVATNADQFSVRIDHKFSPKDQFLARFTMDNLTGRRRIPTRQRSIRPSRSSTLIGSATWWEHTHAPLSPKLVLESLISITRSTPGFPTADSTDPAVKFSDGLFEAFNSCRRLGDAGLRQPVPWAGKRFRTARRVTRSRQDLKRAESRHHILWHHPNGEYDFGGGAAYATVAIPSASGKHNVDVGDPLPDTLSGFLAGSPFAYIVGVAPP